jgi:hypothetical protein
VDLTLLNRGHGYGSNFARTILCQANQELTSQRPPPKGIDREKKHCFVEIYEAQKV